MVLVVDMSRTDGYDAVVEGLQRVGEDIGMGDLGPALFGV